MNIIKRLSLFLLIISGVILSTSAQNTNQIDLGVWQGVMDGDPGEGGLFYRLEFSTDGTVLVKKQYGGHNIEETKNWTISNNTIEISGPENQQITDFKNATLLKDSNKHISYTKNDKSFHLNKWNRAATAIHWIMALLALLMLNELFRRYKWPAVIFFFVLPIVLIPLWSSHGVSYWFKWVKLYSVVFASAWFLIIRFTKVGNKNYAKFIAAAFLAVNIAEAVMQDFSMAYWPNILNGVAGILSIVTIASFKNIHVDNSKYKDMVWPKMTVLWIIAYDIWNFVFVYLNFPGSAATQFLVLLSCTLPSLFIKKGTWLQARGFTLAAWFMYYFTSPLFVESHIVPLPRNQVLMLAAGIISFGANAILAYVHFSGKIKKER